MAIKMKGMSFGKGTGYKSPQLMKKEAAMKMKKAAMKMADEPMMMKKDPMMMKKDSAMDMKKGPMKMKKGSAMDMKKDPMKMKKGSAMKKPNQSERAAARLKEKAKNLEGKLEGASEAKAKRLKNRIANVKNKQAKKEQMAKNIKEGKNKRANLDMKKTRNLPGGGELKTEKKTNEIGKKTNVTRTLSDKDGNVKVSTTKVKSGTGTNKTISKTVSKPKNVPAPKKELTFSQAYAAQRAKNKKAGIAHYGDPKGYFTYKGKKYNTESKSEKQARLGANKPKTKSNNQQGMINTDKDALIQP